MISRRQFFALTSGLFVPYESERIYSFLPAWRLLPRGRIEMISALVIKASSHQEPDKLYVGSPIRNQPPLPGLPGGNFVHRNRLGIVHPSNLIDIQKSAEAFAIPVVFG